MVTIVSQSNIIFPNGGPYAKLNSEEFKNTDYYSHVDEQSKSTEFKRFKLDSATSAE